MARRIIENPGQEFTPDDGFKQVLVGAKFKPTDNNSRVTHCRERQNVGIGNHPDPPDELKPVHGWHLDVRDGQSRLNLDEYLQTLPTVGGGVHLLTMVFQPALDQGLKIGFIVDDQYLRTGHWATGVRRLPLPQCHGVRHYGTLISCLDQRLNLLLNLEHSIEMMQAAKGTGSRGCYTRASGGAISNVIQRPRGTLKRSRVTIIVQVNPRTGNLVERYLEHRRQDLGALLKALDRGEFEHMRHVAHGLVGTGGPFGFQDMSQIGRSLENAVANRRNEEIKLLVEELAEYLSRVEVMYE